MATARLGHLQRRLILAIQRFFLRVPKSVDNASDNILLIILPAVRIDAPYGYGKDCVRSSRAEYILRAGQNDTFLARSASEGFRRIPRLRFGLRMYHFSSLTVY